MSERTDVERLSEALGASTEVLDFDRRGVREGDLAVIIAAAHAHLACMTGPSEEEVEAAARGFDSAIAGRAITDAEWGVLWPQYLAGEGRFLDHVRAALLAARRVREEGK